MQSADVLSFCDLVKGAFAQNAADTVTIAELNAKLSAANGQITTLQGQLAEAQSELADAKVQLTELLTPPANAANGV